MKHVLVRYIGGLVSGVLSRGGSCFFLLYIGERRVPRHAIMEDIVDPPDLWVSTDDDPVPDPKDLDAMLDYCGMTKSMFTASIYMVTREMIESGKEILPMASYEPFVYSKFIINQVWYHSMVILALKCSDIEVTISDTFLTISVLFSPFSLNVHSSFL